GAAHIEPDEKAGENDPPSVEDFPRHSVQRVELVLIEEILQIDHRSYSTRVWKCQYLCSALRHFYARARPGTFSLT
ncbi:MAG TPA: hypothetical protein VMW89_04055, partial [Desulfatiglandales bacterium]|nr:hypothetical protein [Desulfatiglandales bacterium]